MRVFYLHCISFERSEVRERESETCSFFVGRVSVANGSRQTNNAFAISLCACILFATIRKSSFVQF